ncbi:MAG TPA: 2-C-methyl-D-erythritol 4-phosphate cytidylyltransferase [Actinotalea sp.]
MRVAAILTAAGSGSRFGSVLPKALVPLAGVPLVVHAARRLAGSGAVDTIVVTVPEGRQDEVASAFGAVGALPRGVPVAFVAGGPTRQASVAAGLAALAADVDVDVVLVHDAARALAPERLVVDVVAAVRGGARAVVPVLPVVDSIVDVTGGVARHVDRSSLRAVQTPQGFDRALLDRAHAAAGARASSDAAATDDASLCAALGEPVTVVAGDEAALKITVPRDLALAGLILAESSA